MRVAVALIAAALLTACGEDDTACAQCRLEARALVQLGPDDHVLDDSRVVQDRNGWYYVAPVSETGAVAVYTRHGTFHHLIGRAGQGPGELGRIDFVLPWGGDTVAVGSNARLQLLARSGAYLRTIRPAARITAAVPASGDMLLVLQRSAAHDESPALMARDGSTARTLQGAPDDAQLVALRAYREEALLITRRPYGMVLWPSLEARGDYVRLRASWTDIVTAPDGVERNGGEIIDAWVSGDTAWVLGYRIHFAHETTAAPRGEARAIRTTVAQRKQLYEPILQAIDLRTRTVLGAWSWRGRAAPGAVAGPSAGVATIEETDSGPFLLLWDVRIVQRD